MQAGQYDAWDMFNRHYDPSELNTYKTSDGAVLSLYGFHNPELLGRQYATLPHVKSIYWEGRNPMATHKAVPPSVDASLQEICLGIDQRTQTHHYVFADRVARSAVVRWTYEADVNGNIVARDSYEVVRDESLSEWFQSCFGWLKKGDFPKRVDIAVP